MSSGDEARHAPAETPLRGTNSPGVWHVSASACRLRERSNAGRCYLTRMRASRTFVRSQLRPPRGRALPLIAIQSVRRCGPTPEKSRHIMSGGEQTCGPRSYQYARIRSVSPCIAYAECRARRVHESPILRACCCPRRFQSSMFLVPAESRPKLSTESALSTKGPRLKLPDHLSSKLAESTSAMLGFAEACRSRAEDYKKPKEDFAPAVP